jgi:hypothetical protein
MAALAEIDFAQRDFKAAIRHLDPEPLRKLGDLDSAAYVEIQKARLLAMTGRSRRAQTLLRRIPWGPAAALADAECLAFEGRFRESARRAGAIRTPNALLSGEALRLHQELTTSRFCFRAGRREHLRSLIGIEQLRKPYLDTIRRRFGSLDLSRRAGQLELLQALARGPVTARTLFNAPNESHEARLRVAISRLRRDTGPHVGQVDRIGRWIRRPAVRSAARER